MKNHFVVFFIVFQALIFSSFYAKGQNYELNVIPELPHSEVTGIVEDKNGFLWIATLNGLYRYDGYNFRSFLHENNENSIAGNMILSIAEDRKGNIWTGLYSRGISIYLPREDRFLNIPLNDIYGEKLITNDVKAIAFDEENNAWIGNFQGLVKLTLKEDGSGIESVTNYSESIKMPDSGRPKIISQILVDRRGVMWILSDNGVFRVMGEENGRLINKQYGVFAQSGCIFDDKSIVVGGHDGIHLLSFDETLGDYVVKNIYKSKLASSIAYDGKLLWYGNRSGIYSLEFDGKIWQGTNYFNSKRNSQMISNLVSSLMINRKGQLYAGVRGSGVVVIDKFDKHFSNISKHHNRSNLPLGITKVLFEDGNRNLWIGSDDRGATILPFGGDYAKDFKRLEVNEEDDRSYTFEHSGLTRSGDGSDERKLRELIWVGTSYPACLKSFDAKTFEEVKQEIFDCRKIGFVFALEMSDPQTMWVGTYNWGLWRLRLDRDGQIRYARRFSPRNSSLISNIIRYLYTDESGNLWIATDVGVCRIDRDELGSANPAFHQNIDPEGELTLNGNYILQICQGANDEMYFATMGNGLFVYSPKDKKLKQITTEDGLADNSVKSILPEKGKNILWLSSNKGISKYNLTSGSIVNYNEKNGIYDCEFSELSGLRRENGMMLFGNRFGFVEFMPNDIPVSLEMPKMYFTDLYINNHRVEVSTADSLTPLSQTMEFTQEISLSYNQRNFTIGFVGLTKDLSSNGNYKYMLEGFDTEWQSGSSDKTKANYTNIHEGEYVFRVKCSNSDDVWSEDELRLKIRISPPIQRSAYAYALYILVALTISYLIWRLIRHRRELFRSRVERDKARDLLQYKMQFFMDISHEFRTPLTLLTLPLEEAFKIARSNEALTRNLEKIKANSNMLMKLINQLLEFRKIELGKERIKPEPLDLNQWLTTYYLYFEQLAVHKNIDYTFTPNVDEVRVDIDREIFEKVIFNLLSNAFKHTPDGGDGSIKIAIEQKKAQAILTICDNGAGVEIEEIDSIFERFMQGSNAKGGSGIGLSLSRSIVELHGGKLEVESAPGKGFLARVSLPITKKALARELNYSNIENIDIEAIIAQSKDSKQLAQTGNKTKDGELELFSILLVEDNADLRNELKQRLSENYQVYTAENGLVGLELCRKHFPSMIITDVRMDTMNGIEMCRLIREDEQISHTPIMVLTSDGSDRAQIESYEQGGVDAYLQKPFKMDVLNSKIAAILRNRKLRQEHFRSQSIINPEAIAKTPADLKYLAQIIAIIKDEMSNPKLNVEFLATRYGVSRVYLNRKIKALTGETSVLFLRNIRLKYAAKLLLQGEMNVSEVAWMVGYTDIGTFRNRFKELFGVAPTNYKGEQANLEGINIDID